MIFLAKRKLNDARSYLTDMEHEEHRIRLKILAEQLETAQLNNKKAKGDLKEQDLRIQLLQLQISNCSPVTFSIPPNA